MKILIPLNGKGSRFTEKGYNDFKPFIKVLGDSILNRVVSSLKITDEELVIIARKEFRKHNLESYLYKMFPHLSCSVIYLSEETSTGRHRRTSA